MCIPFIHLKVQWKNSSMRYISIRELETLSSTMTHLIRRRVLNYWDSVFPFGRILSLPSDQEEEKEKFWAVWLLPRKKQKRWWITHVEDLINDMELFSHFSHFTVWLVSANCAYLSVSLFVASVSPLEYFRVAFIYKNSRK